MRAIVQRVGRASVTVEGQVTGAIGEGLLVLLAAGEGDTERDLSYMVEKIAHLRIFQDEAGRMNRSVIDVRGAILAVSQFTLYGDCRKGRRPSFVGALEPVEATRLFDLYVERTRQLGIDVGTGVFGAHMDVELVNDGPVTMMIDSRKLF